MKNRTSTDGTLLIRASRVAVMLFGALVIVEILLLLAVLAQIKSVQHHDIEVHRCRNEEVHREIEDKLGIPYRAPQTVPECVRGR